MDRFSTRFMKRLIRDISFDPFTRVSCLGPTSILSQIDYRERAARHGPDSVSLLLFNRFERVEIFYTHHD